MAKEMFYNSVRKLLAFVSVILFTFMAFKIYKKFWKEATGTSLKTKPFINLPFPSVSICDPHFQYSRALKDFGAPMNPFGRPPEIMSAPSVLFRQLDMLEVNISSNIWQYYFTLDKMFGIVKHPCKIGGVSCKIKEKFEDIVYPNEDHAIMEFQVEAGKWTSRMFADSHLGKTYLCHTLVPNVTVDFSVPGGNQVALTWDYDYISKTSYLQVFIHDPKESVVLQTHAINSLPGFTISQYNPNSALKFKKMARIEPRFFKLPSPSKSLPCKYESDYSRNWCLLNWGWERRFDEMKAAYGDKFGCQIMGVWTNDSYKLPECQHAYAVHESDFLGLIDLVKGGTELVEKKMSSPPIGVYRESADCPFRCSYFTFNLVPQEVTEFDDEMQVHDVVLYFASTSVETWTEYRLISALDFLSELGGSLGLILGMSLFSLIAMTLKTLIDFSKRYLKF